MRALNQKSIDLVIGKLKESFGDQVSLSLDLRTQHGGGESHHKVYLPDAVFFARTTEEVSQAVKICYDHRVPVIAFGAGTSVEGHVAALYGGISIDLSQMNSVLEINQDDMDCVVQAGVTRIQLNNSIKGDGLFFPVDPGAEATLGGMAATRASGTNAVRYGTMKENILGLKVVLADGKIVETGGRARKSSAGYDLTSLFIGSEGTLGIITEVRLCLSGLPEAIAVAVCSFPDLETAVSTISLALKMVPLARIELLDEVQMEATNKFSGLNYPVSPTIFFEFHGSEAGIKEQTEIIQSIVADISGCKFEFETEPGQRALLWKARHESYYAALAWRPGSQGLATDVCVPISKLAECILETKKDIKASGLFAPILGHVGDGNFHAIFVLDPNKKEEFDLAQKVSDKMVLRAIEMGGTCTGEHGIGMGKIKYMIQEHGDAVSVMKKIKEALDPYEILNPGKIFPEPTKI